MAVSACAVEPRRSGGFRNRSAVVFVKFTRLLFALLFFYERRICWVIMNMNLCQSHYVLSTRRMFVLFFLPCKLESSVSYWVQKKTKQRQLNSIQHKQKNSNFCFIGSEAEAYDVISDAEGTLFFFFYIGLNVWMWSHVDEWEQNAILCIFGRQLYKY